MAKDNVALICDVAERAGLFEKGSRLEDFLQAVASTVAGHMKAAVCSIYLYDEERQELVLRATQGLNHDAIGRLRMKLGEGITGTALKELRPICAAQGSQHARFKFFPGLQEEQYEAFLAVPILRGHSRVGALVAQDPQPGYFDDNDLRALQAIAAQLATTIENANLFISLRQQESEAEATAETLEATEGDLLIKGRAVSEGFAYGKAAVLAGPDDRLSLRVAPEAADKTEADFLKALDASEKQIKQLQHKMENDYGDVSTLIFSAQLLMLRDAQFSGSMQKLISEGVDAAKAITAIVDDYVRLFSRADNPKLQEKVYDVKDIGHRLLFNLTPHDVGDQEYDGEIVIAGELLPSDILKLSTEGAEGLIMVGGSTTSHVSVLARSLQLPTVVVDDRRLLAAEPGTRLQLDGFQGTVFVNPSDEVMSNYRRLEEAQRQADEAEHEVQPETHTADGVRVCLRANINLLSDVDVALRLKAEGVGLYRSEFPFIVRNSFPSEEEQYWIYRALVEKMAGRPVVLRTLDVGGDKMLSYFPKVSEANPFLGLRAIRFSLRNREVFDAQLDAMLRAGADADLSIVFPLISSVDDFLEAKDVVLECVARLRAGGVAHNATPSLGVMIELPSAVEVIDELAQVADLLCIGSNDLVQYTLAVDRTNEEISDLYLYHHPAVLRSLKRIVDGAARHGTHLSICGEMVSEEMMLPFLLGIGIRSLSANARYIPRIQRVIGSLDIGESEQRARDMLGMGRISEIHAYLQSHRA